MPPGWDGDPAEYQAMFCAMKGLQYMGIDTINGIDWYEDFSSGYKGLYYFIPLALAPNYKRRLRVAAIDTPHVRKVSSNIFQELRDI